MIQCMSNAHYRAGQCPTDKWMNCSEVQGLLWVLNHQDSHSRGQPGEGQGVRGSPASWDGAALELLPKDLDSNSSKVFHLPSPLCYQLQNEADKTFFACLMGFVIIRKFIHSFLTLINDFWAPYHVLNNVLGPGVETTKKTEKNPCPLRV